MGLVKPVMAPVGHATASRPSVCRVPMGITWRAARAASTAPCGRTLRMTARAAAAPRIVTSAQTTGRVSVSDQPPGQLVSQRGKLGATAVPPVSLLQSAVSSI